MSNTPSGAELQALIERIEAVEATIRDEQEARKEIYTEAKSAGFEPKILRHIVKLRREDAAKRAEFEELLEVYLAALGPLQDTPLGQSAVVRKFGVVGVT